MTSNISTRIAGIVFAAALMAVGWVPVVSTSASPAGTMLVTLA